MCSITKQEAGYVHPLPDRSGKLPDLFDVVSNVCGACMYMFKSVSRGKKKCKLLTISDNEVHPKGFCYRFKKK